MTDIFPVFPGITQERMEMCMFRSLKIRIVAIIAVLCIVLLTAEGLTTIFNVRKGYEAILNEDYDLRTQYYSAKIEGWLIEAIGKVEAVESFLNLIPGDPVYSQKPEDYYNDPVHDASPALASFESVLKALTISDEMVSMVYFQLPGGRIINGSGWLPDQSFDGVSRAWYKGAVEDKENYYFCSPYVDASSGQLIVSVAKYVNNNGWEGVVGADLYIESLLEGIDTLAGTSISSTAKDKGYIFVTSGFDDMIYHPNKAFNSTTEKLLTVNDLGIDYVKAAEDDDADAITDYDGREIYIAEEKIPISSWKVYYVEPATNFDDSVNDIRNSMIVIIAICVAVAIVVAVLVGIFIAKPISDASAKVELLGTQVKSGNADLTKNIETRSKDEIGRLVKAVNGLKDAMGSIIGDINKASDSLESDIEHLKSAAGKTSDNVSTISATMEEMSATSQETSASTTQVTQQIADINELTGKVSKDTKEKAAFISGSLKDIESLRTKIEQTDEDMQKRLNDAISKMQERISDTKKVEEIRSMTQGISEVASQTNLLSLNASIEAARAGEAGRGFAVVADEIGTLANNSASMAGSIQQVSEEVLGIVDQLVKAAEEVSDIMLKISKENTDEKKLLIEEYTKSLNECNDAMTAISNDNHEISSAIASITSSINAIDTAVEDNTAGIMNVAEGSQVLVEASEEVLQGAANVDRISSELKNHVKGFRC